MNSICFVIDLLSFSASFFILLYRSSFIRIDVILVSFMFSPRFDFNSFYFFFKFCCICIDYI